MSILLKLKNRNLRPDYITCPDCNKSINKQEAIDNFYVCPKCNNYFRVRTKNRLRMVADTKTFVPWGEEIEETNPLNFPEYDAKLEAVRTKTGLTEGVTIGYAQIDGHPCVLGICDARFLMGSMGSVYGEKITQAVEKATKMRLPVIIFTCSGGARMQEGIVSLMQMAKTSAALKRHSEEGLLYISVLTDPTTGGVTASFAMLGDIILAEPGALIGFAGPRVIEQTISEKLPEGFQRAEFQLEHGFVDAIVERKNLKATLATILKMHSAASNGKDFASSIDMKLVEKFNIPEIIKEKMSKEMPKSAWDRVKISRALERPTAKTLINSVFSDFMEFHGDRLSRDDKAVVGGIATIYGQSVTVVGIQKGNTLEECGIHNYGMASPEGYRKALRLIKQAEKFGRPVICFVNTSGAYPGKEAEEKGQGEAIARNLYELSAVKVPMLSILIGEGGSGGALGLCVANEVWMLENSTYSVLSPEGFASILWKDGSRAKEASDVMQMTAQDLKRLGIIENIVPEFGGLDAAGIDVLVNYLKENIAQFINKYDGMNKGSITNERYNRFRAM